MKKAIKLLVCLLVVASIAVTALAVESVQMTLAADKVSAYRGDTVTFTISMPEVSCLSGGFSLDGLYDEDVFEFVEGYGHLVSIGDVELENPTDMPSGFSNVGFIAGKLSGVFYTTETKTSGVIFTVKMKVKADADFGATEIAPVVALRDANGDITATVNALTVTVVCDHDWSDWTKVDAANHQRECSVCGEKETEAHSFTERVVDDAHLVPGTEETYYYDCAHCDAMGTETFDGSFVTGDLNNDGAVTEQDAIYLLRHVLFYGITGQYPVEQPVDYNKDGSVTEQDAIYLLRHVLFYGITGQYPLS